MFRTRLLTYPLSVETVVVQQAEYNGQVTTTQLEIIINYTSLIFRKSVVFVDTNGFTVNLPLEIL